MARLGILVGEEAGRSATKERGDKRRVCCRQTRWMVDIVRLHAMVVLLLILASAFCSARNLQKELTLICHRRG